MYSPNFIAYFPTCLKNKFHLHLQKLFVLACCFYFLFTLILLADLPLALFFIVFEIGFESLSFADAITEDFEIFFIGGITLGLIFNIFLFNFSISITCFSMSKSFSITCATSLNICSCSAVSGNHFCSLISKSLSTFI